LTILLRYSVEKVSAMFAAVMSDKVRFGPANPHPLSQLKTELVWEGKYDGA
jgi:hypothetical protein